MTILIVENDEQILDLTAAILDTGGYSVAVARNGKEALDVLATDPHISLLLTDLMMPVMNGWILMDAVRRDPRLANLPIVIMTGATVRTQLPSGACLLKKPFRVDALIETVRAQLTAAEPRVSGAASSVA
jgi:CheY-like chemotaxis protein